MKDQTTDQKRSLLIGSNEIRYRCGDRIGGRYEVYRFKVGGMGIVYLCYDHQQQLPIVAKTFHYKYQLNHSIRDRFIQEARVWVQLEKHPNIVTARSANIIEGQPFIVLEYIAASQALEADLRSHMRYKGFSIVKALELMIHVCWGLIYAQSKIPDLVHRDLKPENILLTDDGIAKITDFGLAYAFRETTATFTHETKPDTNITDEVMLTRWGRLLGTPAYMSPEQCLGQKLDMRSDIYALGCIYYEMITGQQPFTARDAEDLIQAHLTQEPALLEKVPKPAALIAQRCLEKRKERRYQSYQELVTDLTSVYKMLKGETPTQISNARLQERDLLNKGLSLYNIGYYGEALDCYDQIETLKDQVYWNNRGNFLQALKRYSDAIVCYDQALSIDPGYAPSWNNKGVTLAALGRLEEAITCYDRALQIEPQYATAWANKGGDLTDLGRYGEAIECCEQALTYNPRDIIALNNKGKALLQMERRNEAVVLFDQILKIDPWQTKAWVNKSAALALGREFDESLANIDRGLEIDSRSVDAWCQRFRTLRASGRASEARASLTQAFSISRAETLQNLFGSRDYQVLLSLEPENAEDWFLRGGILHGLGQFQEALICYERTVSIDAENVHALVGAGSSSMLSGQIDKAMVYYEKVLVLDQNNVEALVDLGAILCDHKHQPAVAAQFFERALILDSRHVHAWHNKGVALSKMGQWRDALYCYEQALRLDSYHSHAWYNKGLALANLRRFEEAILCLERAVSLGMSQARQVIEACRQYVE